MINIIVAYAHNRVIGYQGKVPWHLPDDLGYFKRVTMGHTIVMGRKTFESIGKPLSGRRNVVLTRRDDLHVQGIEVIHSAEDVLLLGDVFIIGGEVVYREFLDTAFRLYVTEVDLDTQGDTFFPEWDHHAFTLLSFREGIRDDNNRLYHTFSVYERKEAHP